MILFKKVRFKNIFSVGNSFVEFDLNKDRNVLITGKSGAGKSTLIDAITYGLFGYPYRDIKLAQMVNSLNEKNLVVEIEFDNYKVIRGMSPNKFEIYKDDELIDRKADLKEYQKMLEVEILKMNFNTFVQIVILGSAAFTPFMKLKAAPRREVIEELLGLHIFTKMANVVKGKMDVLKSEIISIQSKIDAQKTIIQTTQKLFDQMNTTPENKKELYMQALLEGEAELQDLKKERITLLEEHNKNQKAKEDFPVTLQAAEKMKEKLNSSISGYNTEATIANKTKNYILHNESCSVCKQAITELHRADICEDIDYTLENIDKLKVDIETKLQKTNDIIKQITEMNTIISISGMNIVHIDSKIALINNSINNVKQNILESAVSTKTFDNTLEETLNVAKAEITKLNVQYDDLSKHMQDLKVAQTLLKDSGIKTVVINKYIPLLNNRINHYLQMFDLFISFELDAEFNETIKARHRDKYSYNSFSEGQKKRIDFSILLAFRDVARHRNSASCNLLIIDELLDGLDSDNIENMERIVENFNGTNTIFISHSDDLKNRSLFDKSYKTTLVSNFSVYEEA